MEDLILDTAFVIDFERERARRLEGPAHAFLAERARSRLYITSTVAGELAEGFSRKPRVLWEEVLGRFHLLEITLEASWYYGRTTSFLRQNGLLIGANDLWIAATALAHRLPLVTRNRKHFERVPGLHVVGYGP